VRVTDRLLASLRSGDSYGLVFVLLLATLVFGIAAPDDSWARILRDCVLAATVLIAYWTATSRRAFLIPRVVVPGVALALIAVAAAEGAATKVTSGVLGAVITAIVATLVALDVFDRRRVSVQTVLGALSLYVLTGFFFASLYTLAGRLDDGPLFTRGDDGTYADHLYFSFTTMTTTGFGDLAAASGAGRSLAVLEMLLGDLYLVTVVAVLVTASMRRMLTSEGR
jgi:hypothetical protein